MDILTNEEIWKAIGNTPYDDSVGVLQQSSKVSFPPDFNNSLDACFKWLMPWLKENKNVYKIVFWDAGHEETESEIVWQETKGPRSKLIVVSNSHIARGKSPSIAFIKAFTQMVGEG